jgi:hypothetical protein
MLYIVLGLLHIVGNIIHSLLLDRADGKRRAFICANVCGGAIVGFAAWLWLKLRGLAAYDDPFEAEELSRLDLKISIAAEEDFQKLIFNIAVMIAITVLISILLRDIYFIDAILALVPLVYCVYIVLLKDKLILFGELMLGATFFYFVCRMLLMIFEPMRTPKKQNRKARID